MATSSDTGSGKKKTTVVGVVIAILIGGYTLLQPAINEATGWQLPAIAQQDRSDASAAEESSKSKPSPGSEAAAKPETESERRKNTDSQRKLDSEKKNDSTEKNQEEGGPQPETTPSASAAATDQSDSSLKFGLLRDVGNQRYVSPAGLMYTRGSAEGHRLEHLRRHTEDQPNRPGKHGVFDGGMEGALKAIDKAYENAKAGKRTSKQTDRNRTIYTVDMSKRVGYVGGRDGNRRGKPMARRIKLVLEGNRVITAFPL